MQWVATLCSISCGFQMKFDSVIGETYEKHATVNYTQICERNVEGCDHFEYSELPEELREVF